MSLGPIDLFYLMLLIKKIQLVQCNATNNKIVAFIAFNYVNESFFDTFCFMINDHDHDK